MYSITTYNYPNPNPNLTCVSLVTLTISKVTTPYVFIIQHDHPLCRNVNITPVSTASALAYMGCTILSDFGLKGGAVLYHSSCDIYLWELRVRVRVGGNYRG